MQWNTLLLSQHCFSDVPTLTLVAAVVLFTVNVALLYRHSFLTVAKTLRHYIETNVSKSGGELSLFLSAGILAVGISAYLDAIHFALPIEQFEGIHAVALLIISVGLSLMGLHPIISVSVFGGLLSSIPADPNLLGLSLLFSWDIGVVINLLSSIGLLMQTRYGIHVLKLIKVNIGYTFVMMLLASGGILLIYDQIVR